MGKKNKDRRAGEGDLGSSGSGQVAIVKTGDYPAGSEEVRTLADGWGAALGWRGAGAEAQGWEGGSKVRGSSRPFWGPDAKC